MPYLKTLLANNTNMIANITSSKKFITLKVENCGLPVIIINKTG